MAISDYSPSASLNTLLGSIAVGEGMDRELVNDAIRQLMADLATYAAADFTGLSAVGSLATTSDAAATVTTALSRAGVGGIIYADADANIGTTAITNSGTSFIGDSGIYYNNGTSGGNRLLNRPGRSADLHQWGRENLVRWLEGLRANETLKVALVGDSNTEGYVGAALATYLDSLPNITLTNFGVSGTQIEQWRTAASPYNSNSKALSDVVTFDPDLIVMCWGTNDPVVGSRTASDFSTSLAAALTTLRASLGVNACSIALLTPQALGDTSGRDELWNMQIRPIIRAMAERFDCAFYDKNAMFPNSVIDLASGAMQNKWLDSNRVHTADVSTNILAAMIAEWLAPRELWGRTWEYIGTKATANAASTYPPGITVARMSDAPLDGFVLTINPVSTGGHFPIQFNWAFSGTDTRFYWRIAPGGTFTSWQANGPDTLVVVSSIASGYASPGDSTSLNTQRAGNLVSLSGKLTVSPAAQVTTSTTLCNIATTSHRPIFNIQDVEVVALNAGGSVERLRADLTTAGNLVVRQTSTMTDATSVTVNVTYRGV